MFKSVDRYINRRGSSKYVGKLVKLPSLTELTDKNQKIIQNSKSFNNIITAECSVEEEETLDLDWDKFIYNHEKHKSFLEELEKVMELVSL